MMQYLSVQEIRDYCIQLVEACHEFSPYLYDYFYTFYNTGCRPSEPYYIERWTKLSETSYCLQPLKKNNLRIINSAQISIEFRKKIAGEQTELPLLNAAYFSRYIEKIRMYPIFCGLKEVTTFVFRYNFIKQLHAKGLTAEEIKSITGHTNVSMVWNYINAQLFKKI